MGHRTCSIIQAIALAGCLSVTLQVEGEHMDGMRRAVETVSKTKKPLTAPMTVEALSA